MAAPNYASQLPDELWVAILKHVPLFERRVKCWVSI